MRPLSSPRLVVGAVLVAALLLLGVAVVLRSTRQLNDDANRVAHTHEVLTELANLLSLVKDAETGQRGYLITGEPRYLAPYTDAVAAIRRRVDDLQQSTSHDAVQQTRFPEVRASIDAKLNELDETIALRKTVGFDAAREVVLTDRGKNTMDELRAVVAEMTQHEQHLLQERSEESGRAYRVAVLTGLLSGFLALAAFAGFLVVLRAHLAARNEATATIAEQGERLRTTLASIGDAVITTDIEGRVTNMNAVAESLTGWQDAEARGQPLDAVFRIVNETTRLPVDQPATRALRDGAVVGLANHTVLIGRDGRETTIDDSAAPIRCKDGALVGCVLVFRDITERRQAEERERRLYEDHKAATAQFRAFFEQGALFAGIMHVDGTILETNRLALEACGYTKEQVVGKPFWECPWWSPSPTLAERIKAGSAQAAAGEAFRAEMPYFIADGSRRMVDLVIPPIKDEMGHVLFLAPIGTDITERKRLEDELRQLAENLSEADRRKDEFLAMLAHELRNPLAPMRNALRVMRMTSGDGPGLHAPLEMLERQVDHMVRLVDDLLDVSRISRGKIELRTEPIALAAVVRHAVEANRPLCDDMGHALTVSLPQQDMFVNGDPVRLAQVLDNLLNNACKYSEKSGRIVLRVERDGDQAVVRVQDSGIGIAPEHLNQIFEMFAQLDASLERPQTGLGIGLTLVHNLVEMHGGSVEAHSDGLGHGSEFVVRLPVVPPASTPPPQTTVSETVATTGRRVLVVDDNQDSAESLAMLLGLMGHETRTAFDGVEAVEAAATFRPEVVLLDIGLPKLNGYEVARRIREQPWGKDVFLVALTGWGQDGDRRQAKAAGFNRHLVKPVDHETLAKLLAERPPPEPDGQAS